MAIPLMVAMGGSAIAAWGQYQAGQAEAGALKDSAVAKRKQARDLMRRFELNAEFTRLEGKAFKGQQLTAVAASGASVGSEIALSALEDTANKIERRVQIDEMEAEAQRDALLMAADLDWTRAKNASDAGTYGAMGTMATGFMKGMG